MSSSPKLHYFTRLRHALFSYRVGRIVLGRYFKVIAYYYIYVGLIRHADYHLNINHNLNRFPIVVVLIDHYFESDLKLDNLKICKPKF